MPPEPAVKRTYAFIDGQNLFYAAKEAFGYSYPNYDPSALARRACELKGWQLDRAHFYTGVPDREDNAFWNHFWVAKLAVLGTRGLSTFSRPLRYRNQTVQLPDGSTTTILVGQEKGVDVRLALDVVRYARESRYDVALVFSQDQDLSEAVDEVRMISRQQGRWIKAMGPLMPPHLCPVPAPPRSRRRSTAPRQYRAGRCAGLRHAAENLPAQSPRLPQPAAATKPVTLPDPPRPNPSKVYIHVSCFTQAVGR